MLSTVPTNTVSGGGTFSHGTGAKVPQLQASAVRSPKTMQNKRKIVAVDSIVFSFRPAVVWTACNLRQPGGFTGFLTPADALSGKTCGLFGVGEGEVGAEGDHAEAGSGTLTAAERGAGFEFAFERSGAGDDEEVGGGVEGDGKDAESGELQEDVAAFGCDELGDEGEEEQSGLGIEGCG